MHEADILANITKNKSSYTQIGKDLGVTPQAVWGVANGSIKSKRIATAISTTIKKPLTEIWPDKYCQQSYKK